MKTKSRTMWEDPSWSSGRRGISQTIETDEGIVRLNATYLLRQTGYRHATERWSHPRTFVGRLFTTVDAKVRIRCASGSHMLESGELFLLPPGLPFSAVYGPGTLICHMFVVNDAMGFPVFDPPERPLTVHDPDLAASLLPKAESDVPGEQDLRAHRAVLRFVQPLLPHLAQREKLWRYFEPVRDALQTIPPADWRIDYLAARMGCSAGALSKRFRRTHGISLKKFLLQQTVSRAQQSLALTDLPASDIAEALGFGDPAQFHRLFRKETGLTPGQWRKLLSG